MKRSLLCVILIASVIVAVLSACSNSQGVLPEAKLYVIDVTQRDEVPPDLLEQMFMGPTGAGGGGGYGSDTASWYNSYNGKVKPAIPLLLSWSAGPFSSSPLPTAKLTLPDRSVTQLEIQMPVEAVFIKYQIEPGAPLGTYKIEVKQGNIRLVDTVILEMPTEPTQVYYRGNFWFAGFQPNEQVTVSLYYRDFLDEFREPELAALFPELPDYSAIPSDAIDTRYDILAFLKQQTITADEYGSFQIKVISEQLFLEQYSVVVVARGETSGFVADSTVEYLSGSCYSSQPIRLEMGSTARVTDLEDPLEARVVHSSPVYLQSGTIVTVIMGPICDYEKGWSWLVDTADQTKLWVYESHANGYFLEPVNP